MHQYSVTVLNNQLDQVEATLGTAPKFRFYSGSMPASCATAASGTLLAELTLPSDWMNAASGNSKTKLGTWSGTGSAAGSAGYARLYDSSGTTCHWQGTVAQQVQLVTNALTAANGNVLNFAATTGVVVGMNVSGTGIVAGSTVVAVGGTTVTLSHTTTAGVSNSTTITFTGDVTLDNVSIAVSQAISVSTFTLTRGNA